MKSLILLHGALGCQDQMKELVRALQNQFKIYTIEFRGHGRRAENTKPFTLDLLAKDLNDEINFLELQDPIVFGYSMGGYVALYHALKYPHINLSIITLATKFDWNTETAERESSQLEIGLLKSRVPAFIETLKLRHGLHWQKTIENTRELMLQLGLTKPLNESNLTQIQSKTLICIGDKDKMVSITESEDCAKHLPRGELRILTDTPHPFEKVSVDELSKLILQFSEA